MVLFHAHKRRFQWCEWCSWMKTGDKWNWLDPEWPDLPPQLHSLCSAFINQQSARSLQAIRSTDRPADSRRLSHCQIPPAYSVHSGHLSQSNISSNPAKSEWDNYNSLIHGFVEYCLLIGQWRHLLQTWFWSKTAINQTFMMFSFILGDVVCRVVEL